MDFRGLLIAGLLADRRVSTGIYPSGSICRPCQGLSLALSSILWARIVENMELVAFLLSSQSPVVRPARGSRQPDDQLTRHPLYKTPREIFPQNSLSRHRRFLHREEHWTFRPSGKGHFHINLRGLPFFYPVQSQSILGRSVPLDG